MDIGSSFKAGSQSAKLIEPGEGSLDDPSESPQSAAMLSVTHRK